MLKYFFENSQIEEVKQIIDIINKKKKKLERLDFEQPFEEYNLSTKMFETIKQYAIEKLNEQLANSQHIAKVYLHLFCNLASYFGLLKSKEYANSWIILQDCLDDIIGIGRFTEIKNRYELKDINDLLHKYQSLYPYKVFASSEYVVTKSECSICGTAMNSLKCPHIRGNLYWGEMAVENIIDIKEFNAVALVSHPVDKRCIIQLSDDERTETERFQMLDEFINQGVYPFQKFSIKAQKLIKQRDDIIKVSRNDKCTCGSGKKFKKCCEPNIYYEHFHHIITLEDKINFEVI